MATRRASVPTRILRARAMVEETRGFLGRWARRKTDALQGVHLDEPVVPVKPGMEAKLALQSPAEIAPVAPASPVPAADPAKPSEKPVLSLDDVKLLTKDSDFKPFMAPDVGPEVRNAAMKKLFADPHFNVMDGLDIYIDDYSKADPIPESMLRQMVSSKFLKLFDEDDQEEDGKVVTQAGADHDKKAAMPQESADISDAQTVAQFSEPPDLSGPDPLRIAHSSQAAPSTDAAVSPPDHAHSHLRLQPDHAAPAPDLGRGT